LEQLRLDQSIRQLGMCSGNESMTSQNEGCAGVGANESMNAQIPSAQMAKSNTQIAN
jgi:hypothetical protein